MDLPNLGGAYANVLTDSCSFEELCDPSSNGSFGKLMAVVFDKNRVNLIIWCV